MPEKEKSVIVKSKSVQGFENRPIVKNASQSANIFERQVDSILQADCVKSDLEKANTLPPGCRSNFLHTTRKTNSLKRSITLPKNPFSSNKKGKKLHMKRDMAQCGESDKENSITEANIESEPSKTTRRMVKTDSVKSFFFKSGESHISEFPWSF